MTNSIYLVQGFKLLPCSTASVVDSYFSSEVEALAFARKLDKDKYSRIWVFALTHTIEF